jgi:hypothetical protein
LGEKYGEKTAVQEEINPFIKGIVKKPFRISELIWAFHEALS